MLNVSYKNRIGYYTLKSQDGQNKWKIWFCHANCVCAMMHFYKDENKVDMVQVYGFFSDDTHAKRCIEDGFFDDCSGFHFYAKEMDNRMWKLVKLMTKKGIKVTIE